MVLVKACRIADLSANSLISDVQSESAECQCIWQAESIFQVLAIYMPTPSWAMLHGWRCWNALSFCTVVQDQALLILVARWFVEIMKGQSRGCPCTEKLGLRFKVAIAV